MIRVHHLCISPGHNYFGHHGRPASEHPVVEPEQVECVAGRGLCGDRFFDFNDSYKGQVTFFSMETIELMRRELNLIEAKPSFTRRNIFITGADLAALIGREFEIQGVRFAGVEECRPCHWMNGAFGHPASETWLKGRGGLRARVLTDGVLRRET